MSKKVLLAGESWMSYTTHVKGFDSFYTSVYETGEKWLKEALEEAGYEVEFMPNHIAAEDFPYTVEELKRYDCVILSDIGANTLLLPVETFTKSIKKPDRAKVIRDYVMEGGSLLMIGGYLTFSGVDAKGKWHDTAVQAKEFTMDDFSCEHLDIRTKALLEETIKALNDYRKLYIEYNADDFEIKGCPSKKDIWWQMIQLLPSSYNQTRNVMMNYEVLANIYKSRRGHKLDEWCDFCKWIETLPYSEIIMSSSGLDLNSINALQGAARNSSNGYIYKRKTED